MKLTFTQSNSEVGSVVGEGIDWYWSGRDFSGNEEVVDELGEAFGAKLRSEWPEVNEDYIYDIPAIADMEWPEVHCSNIRLNFEFTHEALFEPEGTKEEIQSFFNLPVEFAETLVAGKNVAKVSGKNFEFVIEPAPQI